MIKKHISFHQLTSPKSTQKASNGVNGVNESSVNSLNGENSINGVKDTSESNGSKVDAPEVFLGGSCNPTTWRADVAIPALSGLGISFYNPVSFSIFMLNHQHVTYTLYFVNFSKFLNGHLI